MYVCMSIQVAVAPPPPAASAGAAFAPRPVAAGSVVEPALQPIGAGGISRQPSVLEREFIYSCLCLMLRYPNTFQPYYLTRRTVILVKSCTVVLHLISKITAAGQAPCT